MRVTTAALIWRDERLFLVKRPPGGDIGDRWELPGGKVDAGESPEQALHRELIEELGIDASIGRRHGEARFLHAGARFRLVGFDVEADLSRVALREHRGSGFFTVEEALALNLVPSDESLLRSLGGARPR